MRGKRVLLVEDDADVLDFVRAVIEFEGAAISTASDSASALDRASCDAPFDLIIVDIALPDDSGWNVLDCLDKQGYWPPACHAVIFSAHMSEDDYRRSLDAGVSRYILKPIGAPELRNTLIELLATAPPERRPQQ